jgi:hypothetical protein
MTHSFPNWKSLAAQRVPAVQLWDLFWKRRWLGYPRYWRWQFLGWGLLFASQTIPPLTIPGNPYVGGTLFITISFFLLCLVCSHFLRGVLIGLRECPLTWGGMLLRLLPWFILLSAMSAYFVSLIGLHLLPSEFSRPYFAGQSPELLFLANVIYIACTAFLVLV